MASLGTKRNVLGGVFKAVASGSIANGKACRINSDGTVSQATSEAGKKIVFAVGYNNIYQYKLLNAFDVTAVETEAGEGTYAAAGSDGAGYQDQFYSLVSGQESGIECIQFNDDGTKFFVAGYQGDDLNE